MWLLPGEGVIGRFADGLHLFPGAVAERCATLLAGESMSPEAMFSALATTGPPQDLFRRLEILRSQGLIVADDGSDRQTGLDLDSAQASGSQVWRDLGHAEARTGVSVVLARLGNLSDQLTPPGPWLAVEANAQRITIGPLFRGDDSDPCLECLVARANGHDDLNRLLDATKGSKLIQSRQLLQQDLDREIAFVCNAIEQLVNAAPGAILYSDWSRVPVSTARCIPRGGCASCGALPVTPAVASVEKAVLRNGGYRPLAARDVLAKLTDTIDPVTGVIRKLDQLQTDCEAARMSPVYLSHHIFPLATPDGYSTIRNRQGRSAGKGRQPAEARLGAIAEALERYAGLARSGDVDKIATTEDLDGPFIQPHDWAAFSAEQMRDVERWRALREASAWVPDPSTSHSILEWTRVQKLTGDGSAWAPAALCWHQFVAAPGCATPGLADSNGCAAGQTRLDAQLQGLLELIERDAVGIWWWTRSRRPEIAPGSIGDPWLDQALDRLSTLGFDTSLQDLTHDLGVPVVAAIAWPRDDRGPMLLGFGAHPSPEVAVSRSVTELMQALPSGTAAETGGTPWAGLGLTPGSAPPSLGDFAFLRPSAETRACHSFDGVSVPPSAMAAQETLLNSLRVAELNVWWLDQSRQDVALPVVRMIVPGLCHLRPRFATLRLDQVPKALGWCPDPAGRNPCFIRQ